MSFYWYYIQNRKEQARKRRLRAYNRKHGLVGWYCVVKEGRVLLDKRGIVGIVIGAKKPLSPKTDKELGYEVIYKDGIRTLRKTYTHPGLRLGKVKYYNENGMEIK